MLADELHRCSAQPKSFPSSGRIRTRLKDHLSCLCNVKEDHVVTLIRIARCDFSVWGVSIQEARSNPEWDFGTVLAKPRLKLLHLEMHLRDFRYKRLKKLRVDPSNLLDSHQRPSWHPLQLCVISCYTDSFSSDPKHVSNVLSLSPVLNRNPVLRHSHAFYARTSSSSDKKRAQSLLDASRQLLCMLDTEGRHHPSWNRHERWEGTDRQGCQGGAREAGKGQEDECRGST